MGIIHVPRVPERWRRRSRRTRIMGRAVIAITVLCALALAGGRAVAYGATASTTPISTSAGAQESSLVQPGDSGTSYGGFPTGFWGDTSSIPSASGAIEFDFVNATNGQYPDNEVYWDVNGVEETIAQSPYYTMTACNSCRIYFYLGSPSSQ